MQIEEIRLKNFRTFKNITWKDIPRFAVVIGANGSGKSTLFSVFGFLREAMTSSVTIALAKLGGSRGFQEVRSRGAEGPIEIEIKFRPDPKRQLITYQLEISEKKGRVVIEREVLKYRRGSRGKPWHFLDFSKGKGEAVTNESSDDIKAESDLERESENLKSPDLLAIKGLAQFERFPAAVDLGNLIERWHISDFHINRARPDQEVGYAEHLSREGENLSLVIEYLHNQHPEIFQKIISSLSQRVPGISNIEAKQTEEGRILLKFQDGAFEDPFLARFVSDGTIKMLAYLTLLYDPSPHPLLCVEEPENQLHPRLLGEIAEEFRLYANKGGQVFVSTHSPDFLNATQLDEVFWLKKSNGYTEIKRAQEDRQIREYMESGAKMGHLWSENFFEGADPE